MMRDLTELDRLENWLRNNGYEYTRTDRDGDVDFHQIIVYRHHTKIRSWDAICHYGSYGAERGLLEIYGDIVPYDVEDSVEGWLTASDVIKRISKKELEQSFN